MTQGSGNRLLVNRYRLFEPLGSGGTASVHLARDERLGRAVAVKLLRAGASPEAAERFRREAKLLASLSHPNVVRVYDADMDGDDLVIVMEHVAGETLADALARGPLAPRTLAGIVRALAGALDHAHARGIVHRDVKPGNVLLGPGGVPKLVDLGIATAAERTQVTRSGAVLGTPAYMAPEQLSGGKLTPAVDIYALAAMSFEALSGCRANRGRTPIEVAQRIASGPAPDLRQALPGAPPGLAAAVRRGMAREPRKRPRSAGAFAEELARAVEAAPPPVPAEAWELGLGSGAARARGRAAPPGRPRAAASGRPAPRRSRGAARGRRSGPASGRPAARNVQFARHTRAKRTNLARSPSRGRRPGGAPVRPRQAARGAAGAISAVRAPLAGAAAMVRRRRGLLALAPLTALIGAAALGLSSLSGGGAGAVDGLTGERGIVGPPREDPPRPPDGATARDRNAGPEPSARQPADSGDEPPDGAPEQTAAPPVKEPPAPVRPVVDRRPEPAPPAGAPRHGRAKPKAVGLEREAARERRREREEERQEREEARKEREEEREEARKEREEERREREGERKEARKDRAEERKEREEEDERKERAAQREEREAE